VRHSPEYLLIAVMGAFALTGVVATAFDGPPEPTVVTIDPIVPVQPFMGGGGADAAGWFESIRRFCNPVEIETQLRWQPAPPTPEGDMHKAACYALSGKIDQARVVIDGLPQELRWRAAGVVFEAGHPAADAGDEIAAGPLMELVVDYWPNHYMALYHAGAARFERESYDASKKYLEQFLVEYAAEDGWRSSALSMLEQIDSR